MAQAYSSDVTMDDGPGPNRPSDSSRRPRLRWQREGMWRRGIITAAVAVILTLVLFLHADVPNRIGNLGSLLETFLPWLGLAIPLLLLVALLPLGDRAHRRAAAGRPVAQPFRRPDHRQGLHRR
jgi:vancomycin resistance protein VanJ